MLEQKMKKMAAHSEPELRQDGFEMNLGNDYYPSPVPHVGFQKTHNIKNFT